MKGHDTLREKALKKNELRIEQKKSYSQWKRTKFDEPALGDILKKGK